MSYGKKPKMILFDVGGTLFDDSACIPLDGLAQLRLAAVNPDVTDDQTLAALWDGYMSDINNSLRSKSGATLDMPLSAAIKYVTMKTGPRFNISMPEQEEIFDRYNSERRVIDGIPELLETISSLGIRSAVISNNAMSGDGLALAIKRWIPNEKFEFFLTSADILLAKPNSRIFEAAAAYANLNTADCWYCGDGRIPDVDGSFGSGMTPVLIDTASPLPLEYRTDGGREYMAVNSWHVLKNVLTEL